MPFLPLVDSNVMVRRLRVPVRCMQVRLLRPQPCKLFLYLLCVAVNIYMGSVTEVPPSPLTAA